MTEKETATCVNKSPLNTSQKTEPELTPSFNGVKTFASSDPLQDFAQAVAVARRAFEANPGITTEWLAYYEAKQAAYAKLVAAIPQIEHVEDFWRYVQSVPASGWLPIIERELKRIIGHHCRDCPAPVPITRTLCDECRKAARAESLRQAQARKREEDKLPRCPECGTNPILAGQRKCEACRREARRNRNARHRKCLKELKVRRVEADFPLVSPVITPSKRIKLHPPSTVDAKASHRGATGVLDVKNVAL
jgi:hypothetical protein